MSKGDWSSKLQFGVQQKLLKNVLNPKHPHPIPQQRFAENCVQQFMQIPPPPTITPLLWITTKKGRASSQDVFENEWKVWFENAQCCVSWGCFGWYYFMFSSNPMPSSIWKSECLQRLQSSSLFASSPSYQIHNEPINFKCSQIWYYRNPKWCLYYLKCLPLQCYHSINLLHNCKTSNCIHFTLCVHFAGFCTIP